MKKNILFTFLSTLIMTSCSTGINPDFDTNILDDNISSQNFQTEINKPSVITINSPNQSDRPENTKISAIVLHHTAMASDAKAVGGYFANPQAKVSSHYIVDRTGYIVQSVPDDKVSWHAGKSQFNGVQGVNYFSIGIEICNVGNSIEPYSDAQYDGIIKLVAYLMKEYNIPASGITRHRDIAIPAGRKVDTSDNFSVQKVVNGVQNVFNGTYQYLPLDTPIVNIPNNIEIITKAGENSLEDIADIYLDNEKRANELEFLNKNVKDLKYIPVGTRIKIPTDYSSFYKINNIKAKSY